MSRRKPQPSLSEDEPGWLSSLPVSFSVLWLTSFILQMVSTPDWMVSAVRVVDPPSDCVISGSAGWSSPLSLAIGQSLAEWPSPVFSAVVATLLALTGLHLASSLPAWLTAVFIASTSLCVEPQHLMPAGVIFGISALTQSAIENGRSRIGLRILLAGMIIAVLVTIEYGFVFIIAGCMLPGIPVRAMRERGMLMEIAGVLLCGIIILIATAGVEDFVSTLLRPLSWLWISTYDVGITSNAFALSSELFDSGRTLAAVFLVCIWMMRLRRSSRTRRHDDASSSSASMKVAQADQHFAILPLLAASMIGLCCGRFFWLAACSAAATDRGTSTREIRSWSLQFLGVSILIVFAVEGTLQLHADGRSLVFQTEPSVLVDPADWDVTGNVLVMDLDQSADWQTGPAAGKFSLLLDDRWDIHADRYTDYAAVCRDLFELRADSYLRDDGLTGGYNQPIADWKPVLLVMNSSHVSRIRQLSLSPHWNVLGLDGRRTIFGRANDPQIASQRKRAMSTLLSMEWPSRPADNIDSVLVAGNDHDLRRVSAVLCAIRLPYAALRSLPSDEEWSTRKIRAWCYLELAHRTRRHSGQVSLLDQVRAVTLVREIHAVRQWNASELLRAARSMEGLDQIELAHELSQAVESGATFGSATTSQRRQASILSTRLSSRLQAAGPLPKGTATAELDVETRLRRALAAGDLHRAEKLIGETEPSLRPIYALLISAPGNNAAELASDLSRILNWDADSRPNTAQSAMNELPHPNQSEAFFILGCLTLESGDARTSARAFLESNQREPHSPYRHIRDLNIRQLTR